MTYQTFKQTLIHFLQSVLDSDSSIFVQDILKNNDTHFDGLTILYPNCNLSPTIYLNNYFQEYERGRAFCDICAEIQSIYQKNKSISSIDVSFFTSYEKVHSHIVFKLINYEQNKTLLEEIPHVRLLDLAIIFHCLIDTDSHNLFHTTLHPSPDSAKPHLATILIHNHHLSLWNITKEDLYTLACVNTPKLQPYELRNMNDVLKELFGDTKEFHLPEETSSFPMYVLSNRTKLHGSACILYKDLLKNFAERFESDLFILPSSIHEVLIIPADSFLNSQNETMHQTSCPQLSDMVRDVNATQLSAEDILSDHVYYFSRETGRLTM